MIEDKESAMANRNRTDPTRSAQQEIFRGATQNRGNQLNAQGGRRGSDIGSTQPLSEQREADRTNDRPGKRRKDH
jgi:hypothetical protein